MTTYEQARAEFEDAFRAFSLLRSQSALELALKKQRALLALQPRPSSHRPYVPDSDAGSVADLLHGDVETRQVLTEIGALLPRRSLR